jgi:hypothetical membrane protein
MTSRKDVGALELICLNAGVAVPLVYCATLIGASLLNPRYSQARQQVSELGARGAAHPEVFNFGTIMLALLIECSAAGFFLSLRRLGSGVVGSAINAGVLVLFGISTLMAALFPLPDPRHGGGFLGAIILLGPVTFAVALWKQAEARALNAYLIATNCLMGAMFAILLGAGGLITDGNAGIIQRVFVLAGMPWIGIAAWKLKRIREA